MQFRNELSGWLTIRLSLDSLAHRRSVSSLFLFYNYHYCMCSDKLKLVIPRKACIARILPYPNILSRLDWKSAGLLYLAIHLSPWLEGSGTLSRPNSFPTLITFKYSKLRAQTPTPFRHGFLWNTLFCVQNLIIPFPLSLNGKWSFSNKNSKLSFHPICSAIGLSVC